MSAYQTDILAQPVALQDTLDALSAASLPQAIRAGLRTGQWSRIVLTGMGSSYLALLPLYQRLLEAGVAVWLVETSEMIHSRAFFTPHTLVIVASQSGVSAETTRLLDRLGKGQTLIGLTNTPGSPLAQRAAYALLTQAGEEATVSCKTYLTALAAQCWLGDQLVEGSREFTGLLDLPEKVSAYLDGWQEHVAFLQAELAGVEQIYLTGRGISLASAGTGGLILKESVQIPAEGMSSAGFRHGPFEMVRPETFVLVFLGAGETTPLNRRLFNDISGANGRAALVSADGQRGAYALPACPPAALPVLEILPVQMMTLALAKLKNITAGSFTLGSKVTTTE